MHIHDALSDHFGQENVTKINLLALSKTLLTMNPHLPKPTREQKRSKIYDWYRTNWNSIYPAIRQINTQQPENDASSTNTVDPEDDEDLIDSDIIEY